MFNIESGCGFERAERGLGALSKPFELDHTFERKTAAPRRRQRGPSQITKVAHKGGIQRAQPSDEIFNHERLIFYRLDTENARDWRR